MLEKRLEFLDAEIVAALEVVKDLLLKIGIDLRTKFCLKAELIKSEQALEAVAMPKNV